MDGNQSLSHTVWKCKYHVVWIPKYRRKSLYEQLRKHLGQVFRELARYMTHADSVIDLSRYRYSCESRNPGSMRFSGFRPSPG